MERGYLKLWRRSLDSEVFHNPNLWRLWTWCLMKTTYKDRFVPFQTGKGKISIKVESGQFIFGRNKAAEFLGDSPSTVWRRMKKLEVIGNIKIESNKQYSIVSLCNWEEYQTEDEETGQAADKQRTSSGQAPDNDRTTSGQLADTNKKVKKEKKENNTDYSEKFETFWKEYPNKKGKFKAFTSWKKYNCDNGQFESIMKALAAYKTCDQWTKDDGEYIPHGSTWVNGRGWDDEPEENELAGPKSKWVKNV